MRGFLLKEKLVYLGGFLIFTWNSVMLRILLGFLKVLTDLVSGFCCGIQPPGARHQEHEGKMHKEDELEADTDVVGGDRGHERGDGGLTGHQGEGGALQQASLTLGHWDTLDQATVGAAKLLICIQ